VLRKGVANARIVVVNASDPDADAIREAARVIRAGGLVAFPTETVYGLGARALDPHALAKVFAAKGRPRAHPLIAHVTNEDAARALAPTSQWPEQASKLARAFWPGPLTLVVARAPSVPAEIAGGADSIAIRAPAHPIARALIAAVGEPIAAPSANKYQSLSPVTAAHVAKSLAGEVDLILDGGPCSEGIESTVVDVRTSPARVLRPGALDLARLREIVPDIVVESASVAERSAKRASPGMDARHYAPRAKVVVVETRHEAERAACGIAGSGARVGLVLHTPPESDAPLSLDLAKTQRIVTKLLPPDAAGYARAFFTALHELDDAGVDAIVVENVPNDDAWWAVADRLRRGATPSE
jgi:L-threonylcarbamoyladenylate synthase